MTLVLDNAAVRRVLRMPAAIAALVASFSDLAAGRAGRTSDKQVTLPTEWFTQEERP